MYRDCVYKDCVYKDCMYRDCVYKDCVYKDCMYRDCVYKDCVYKDCMYRDCVYRDCVYSVKCTCLQCFEVSKISVGYPCLVELKTHCTLKEESKKCRGFTGALSLPRVPNGLLYMMYVQDTYPFWQKKTLFMCNIGPTFIRTYIPTYVLCSMHYNYTYCNM